MPINIMTKKRVIASLNPLFFAGIAHRGLHTSAITENGLAAFKNAIEDHFAFELDVHLTTDHKLIVCHDSELKRTTGKEGIIEHLSSEEIRANYRLLDGGVVPTFQEVLELDKEQLPIVVELKVYEKNYKPLAKQLKEELSNIKDTKNIMLISFDPRALFQMKHTGFIRCLLVSTGKYEWIYSLRHFFDGVDLDYKLFEKKRIQRYHKHALVNAWTIDSKEKFDASLPYIDTATFQLMDSDYVRTALIHR